jgi:hypothetical protein
VGGAREREKRMRWRGCEKRARVAIKRAGEQFRKGAKLPLSPPNFSFFSLPQTHAKKRTCDGRDERPQRQNSPNFDRREPSVAQINRREREQREGAVRCQVPALGHGERGVGVLSRWKQGGSGLGRAYGGDGGHGLDAPIFAVDDARHLGFSHRVFVGRRRRQSTETHELRRRRAPVKPLESWELSSLALRERGGDGFGPAAAPGKRGLEPSEGGHFKKTDGKFSLVCRFPLFEKMKVEVSFFFLLARFSLSLCSPFLPPSQHPAPLPRPASPPALLLLLLLLLQLALVAP